jgi:16S rRNA (adenine1518-N6/adenine1519-N6)-dimethyltransferase
VTISVKQGKTMPQSDFALGPEPPYNLTDSRVVRRVEYTYNLRARKSFSQHWLVDHDILMDIVNAAELTRDTHVLETGAGMGVLTAELGRRAGKVVAVEIERDVIPVLRDMTRDYPEVQILQTDLMQIEPAQLFGSHPYKLIANLPYAITSQAIRHYLETSHQPERMIILIQQEVADRIMAKPGDMSLLSLSTQFYSTPRLVAKVPPNCFMPPPEVNSAILALDIHPPPAPPPIAERIFTIARIAFSQRRKQLHNILPGRLHLSSVQVHDWLESSGISPDRRPQTLSIEEWIRLAEMFPGR